jgi:hypothetical protein
MRGMTFIAFAAPQVNPVPDMDKLKEASRLKSFFLTTTLKVTSVNILNKTAFYNENIIQNIYKARYLKFRNRDRDLYDPRR